MKFMDVFLSIGTNIGDLNNNIRFAKDKIEKKIGKIVKQSAVYETSPWGFESKNNFYNQVIKISTFLNPYILLGEIKDVEREMGRKTEKNDGVYLSRIIDIDILFYGDQLISSGDLIIPHKFLQDRLFVLVPLNEIAPDFVHPLLNKRITTLLKQCTDKSEIKIS